MTTTELDKVDNVLTEDPPLRIRKGNSIDLGRLVSDSPKPTHDIKNNIPIELIWGLVLTGAVIGAIKGYNSSESYPYLSAMGGYFIGGVLGATAFTTYNAILKDIKSAFNHETSR